MGSSRNYVSGGSRSGSNYCGGIYKFQVVIVENEAQLLSSCNPGDLVEVVLINENLPKLEIRRTDDDYFIGYAPASLSKFIDCIGSGWKYTGEITEISGDEYQPEIFVQVEGVK